MRLILKFLDWLGDDIIIKYVKKFWLWLSCKWLELLFCMCAATIIFFLLWVIWEQYPSF